MTSSDGMNPQNWDDARLALRRVADFFNSNDDFTMEQLRALENYELIPGQVRSTLETLSPDERDVLKRVFTALEENQFYLERSRGGLEPPY